MRCFKVTLAYDGSQFAGWQVQPGRRTVQGAVEAAIARVTGQQIRVMASGRTDAGVHARGQVISFTAATRLECARLRLALEVNTPESLSILEVAEVPSSFHATLSAISKRYRYLLQEGPLRDVFQRHYAWQLRGGLNLAAMRAAAPALVGRHDFRSFETTGSPRADSVRTVTELTVDRTMRDGFPQVVIEIEADGFLYHMVRNIVGSLITVGRDRQRPAWLGDVLAARDRRRAGITAPPQGLYLLCVRYSEFTTEIVRHDHSPPS